MCFKRLLVYYTQSDIYSEVHLWKYYRATCTSPGLKKNRFQRMYLHLRLGIKQQKLSKNKQVSPEKPYFLHNGKKMYVIYDPLHLPKKIRNNFKRHDNIWKSTGSTSVILFNRCKNKCKNGTIAQSKLRSPLPLARVSTPRHKSKTDQNTLGGY